MSVNIKHLNWFTEVTCSILCSITFDELFINFKRKEFWKCWRSLLDLQYKSNKLKHIPPPHTCVCTCTSVKSHIQTPCVFEMQFGYKKPNSMKAMVLIKVKLLLDTIIFYTTSVVSFLFRFLLQLFYKCNVFLLKSKKVKLVLFLLLLEDTFEIWIAV